MGQENALVSLNPLQGKREGEQSHNVCLPGFYFLLVVATLTKAWTGPKRREAKEEYPGPREGREEEHFGVGENSLGQGTKEHYKLA